MKKMKLNQMKFGTHIDNTKLQNEITNQPVIMQEHLFICNICRMGL